MADFIAFTAGDNLVLDSGLAGSVKFALSTRPCSGTGAHKVSDTVGGGIGEITGTGYARQEETAPAASEGKKVFAVKEWKTEAHTDWPSSVKSVVAIIGSVAVCAWNLRPEGLARDLSGENTTEHFTPTYQLS